MNAQTHYLAMAKSGDLEGAFHGLRELGPAAFLELQASYHSEDDAIVRALIVEVLWKQRQPAAIGFLATALADPAPQVWKQALDGLVALASPNSVQALRSAADREHDPERLAWLEEAIGQAADAIE